MYTAEGGWGRGYAPELCGFYGMIPGTQSYEDVHRTATLEAQRRIWDTELLGSAFAVRLPFGMEARAEDIPPWAAFLGVVLIAGIAFALFCL